MASITLNKPSGGQLTISPEDGATNETVTIPSVGVGKVLQVQHYKQQTSLQRDMFGVGTSVTDLNNNWADIGGTSSVTFSKQSDDSVLFIESVCHVYADQTGAVSKWAVIHQGILVNSTRVASTTNAPASTSAYGVAWNSSATDSRGRSMNYSTLATEVSGVPSGAVDIRIQGTAGTSNTVSLNAMWNKYGEGHIRVMEVAQ